ncbi:CheY-P-specific phosphatase CheC [Oceanobacillus sp. 143]|uniref:CheY-P-specific phosphatase CheC n=1 Tax=Oceanobacillus zhaokaii TaxID=2052660 RepID=A0A345PGH3_9BACI|nr:chemotaxis protein CheC [Oceanobacillus zhaokaii]AXI09103.1 CheY-P-specific phosphatase CheC [Oceanobacillus zhaokaii]QGS68663.1 CheY-P-specific phosphatase CheC [Oceanobacillus sp. 143]
MEYLKLTSTQKDLLREIGNIGSGNAATSMAKLTNRKINMQVPSVNILDFDQMMEMIGGAEELIVALLFEINGEVPGTVYFILKVEEAEMLVRNLTDNQDFSFTDNCSVDEMTISVLQEIGNIVTGSYLTALSDFTNINMQPSVPHLSIDMAGAVLTMGIIELSQVSDCAIIIDTKIQSIDLKDGIHGHFFFVPFPEALPKLFKALGISEHL